MHVLFVVLALAISANNLARSTSTATEKSDPKTNTSTLEEERGGEVFKLLGKEIQVAEPVKMIVETQQKPISRLEHEIRPEPMEPPPKTITLLGKTIPVADPMEPIPVPDPMEPPPKTITLLGKTIPVSDHMEPIPVPAPVHPKEVDHSVGGMKRKRTFEVRGRAIQIRPGYRPQLPDLIKVWHIDATQLEERKREISLHLQRKLEISRHMLPHSLRFSDDEVDCMAIGSIFFERKLKVLPVNPRLSWKLLENKLKRLDDSRLELLGVERAKLNERAYDMWRNGLDIPRNEKIVYMALGKEFYDSLHPTS